MFKKTQSLKRRIMIWSSLLILITEVLIIGFSYKVASDLAKETGISDAKATAIQEKLVIENHFKQFYDIAGTISSTVMTIRSDDSIKNKREVVEKIIEDVLVKNPYFIGIGIGFEPNVFDNEDDKYGRFIPYITYQNRVLNNVPIKDIETSEFYRMPKETLKPSIIEPYEYIVQGKSVLMTTIVVPLIEDNKFIGIVGVDIPIDTVQNKTMEIVANQTKEASIVVVSNKGKIVACNDRPKLLKKHISILHNDYIEDIDEVEKYEIASEFNEENKFEVILPINIGDINTHWYIFYEIEEAIMLEDTVSNIYIITIIGLITMILSMLILRFLVNKTVEPILLLTNKMDEFDINNIDSFELDSSTLLEVNTLGKVYSNILDKLKENFIFRDKKDWLQMGQVKINNLIQDSNQIQELANQIIVFMTKQVNGQIGMLYLLDTSETENEEKQFNLIASYAYKQRKGIATSYKIGEGIIGQVAQEREMITILDIPSDYVEIDLGVGSSIPKNIVVVPCEINNEVIAVLEIGLISEMTEDAIEYLESIKTNIAIAFSNIINFNNVENLLKQTKLQSSELQDQQEKLKNSNEELHNQHEELRVMNEELKQNSIELEKKARDIEMANQYKSEFLANMSHELRTPLNSILILSELLSENNKKHLADKEIEFASTINSSGRDLLELINDILDLSKVESGKTEIVIDEMSMPEFKTTMTNLFRQIAIKKGINFEVLIGNEVSEIIMTDEQKVKQIIKNLLSNAFKFTDEGEVNLNVKNKRQKIIFEVRDTGVGISKENIEHIFDAFQQEDGTTSRQFGGTGLGLSISKEYAKLLNGSIEVESVKGEGSVFRLILPVVNKAKDIRDFEDKINNITNLKSILVAEDNEIQRKSIVEIIRRKYEKISIFSCGFGDKTLEILSDRNIDLLVLDLDLPDYKKFELIERIREDDRYKDVQIIVYTAQDISKKEEKYLKKKVHDVIIKGEKSANRLLDEIELFKHNSENVNNEDEFSGGKDEEVYKGKTILIVDDDMRNVFTLSSILERTGVNIEVANDGQEAVEEVRNNDKIDLVLMDIMMHGMDGYEAMAEIRKDEKFKELPIIALTAKVMKGDKEKCIKAGANDYLSKPIEKEKLMSLIRSWLKR